MPNVATAYDDLIQTLHTPMMLGSLTPSVLSFTEDAHRVRERFGQTCHKAASLEAVNKKLAAHIGKYTGIFARLCIVWHCVEHGGHCIPREITGATAERVAAFMQ
jgi:hypothetical protein